MAHQDGEVGMSEHVARNTAQDQTTDRVASERADDQHAGCKLAGLGEQYLSERTLARNGKHVQIGAYAVLLEDIRQARSGAALSHTS
jgi:hypothetical protein